LEKAGFSCWELIFAIFWKLRSDRNDNIFVFAHAKESKDGKKQANVQH